MLSGAAYRVIMCGVIQFSGVALSFTLTTLNADYAEKRYSDSFFTAVSELSMKFTCTQPNFGSI